MSCFYTDGKISVKIKNTLKEIEILKAASSKYLLNDVIAGQNDPIYKLLPTSVIWTPRSTAQAKQQTKIQKFKNQQNNKQWFKLQLSTAQASRQKWLQHPQDLLIMLL